MSDFDAKDEDESSSDEERIGAEGLSADTLALLMNLVPGLSLTGEADVGANIDPTRDESNLKPLDKTEPGNAVSIFNTDGVVKIASVLNNDLCDRILNSINECLQKAQENGTDFFDEERLNGFGNVDSSDMRWDMFLSCNPLSVEMESLTKLIGSADTILSAFFHELLFVEGSEEKDFDMELHEFAALISDKGATSQRIHSDTTIQPTCPLYTVFVALQDVTLELGPTVFIKGSHDDKEMHQQLRFNRDAFLSSSQYSSGILTKGDIIIMDSRCMHCGSANTQSRRGLLYLTMLSPTMTDPGGGSKFADLNWTLQSLQEHVRK